MEHQFNSFFPPHSGQSIQASNRRYELVMKEQPQQCQISGFGEKDRLLPMNPTPIVQLVTYQDDQLVEPDEQHHTRYIVHVSLWSKNQTQPLDLVHIINNKEQSTLSTPVRTMVGTLSRAPLLLYDQQHQLGVYFSFPDIGVRVTNTYCLKFDLILLADDETCSLATHIYSDPFIAYTAQNYPEIKDTNDLTKHLVRQGLQISTTISDIK